MRIEMKSCCCRAASALKKYRSEILYYCGVALVLTAVALAADGYRRGGEELVIQEAEITEVLQSFEELKLFRPEGMRLLRKYNALPEWNDELRQWECHGAADYAFEDDCVLCLQQGIVLTIGESGVYGGFVEVDCGGKHFRYASIEPDGSIEPGAKIEVGERIGRADCSMPGEEGLGAHLHLEIREGGRALDPESL